MQIERLGNYEFPDDMIANWRQMGIAELQPIQQEAIQRYKLFNGNSMIVSAPTSSGKTFVGELAAVYQAIHEKKTAFLVPLKAIAEEKFNTFKQMYSPSGIRVVVSSRDHKEFDGDIETGNFDIAIIVFEKFFQLMNGNKKFLGSLGLVVIDELQMLADETRGTNLELILTHLRMQKKGTFQIVGLSAVLGNHRLVNEWLGIDLLHYERRPVELRIGYLYQGVYHYRSMNDHSQGEELILNQPPAVRQDVLYAAVAKFANDGEQSLLFLKDKNSVRGVARALSEILTCPPAVDAIAELETLEDTHSRDELIALLQVGVSIHHADLTLEERELVERFFRNRSIRVLVSTSTLAMGVNLPTRNVFIELQKWYSDVSTKRPYSRSMSKSDFENMGGRAGRFQMEDEFGRAIALAHTLIEREQIRHKYIEGQIENIVPCLWKETMSTTVLGIVSLGSCHTAIEVKEFIRNTLSWHVQAHDPAQQQMLESQLDHAIHVCLLSGVIEEDIEGKLKLTKFGAAVASFGIRVETAKTLRIWLEQRGESPIRSLEAILFAVLTEDGQDAFLNYSTDEFRQRGSHYEQLVKEQLSVAAQQLYREQGRNQFDDYNTTKFCKTTLLLSDFTGTLSNKEIELHYQVYFGTVKRVAEQISWVISAAAVLSKVLEKPESWQITLDLLALEVQYGVPEDGLYLAQLRIPRLGRERIRKLVKTGITTEQQILDAGVDYVAKVTTRPLADTIMNRITEIHTERENASKKEESEIKTEIQPIGTSHQYLGHIVVNNNHGTIVINGDNVVPGSKTEEGSPVSLDNFSELPLTIWQQEVTQRLDTLNSDQLTELFSEIRALRHNRIQAVKDSVRVVKTKQELAEISKRLQTDYQTYYQLSNDKLHAIVLPSFDSDFMTLLKSRQVLETVRIGLLALLDAILKSTTRFYNLLKTYKTSPESLLLEAVELCRPVMNGTVIDDTGLTPALEREERFFSRQVVVEAFSNLLRNAESSLIGVDSPRINLASRIDDEHSVLTIQDNGCGIPPERQSEIFKDGYSTKGTDGIGLTHTMQTLKAIGGTIRLVSSRQKQGTTFEVVL